MKTLFERMSEAQGAPSGTGSRAPHEAASCTASSPKASIPSAANPFDPIIHAQRHDDWASGLAEGMRWYADYVQRVAEIRSRVFADADMWWPADDREFAYESPEHWARENSICPDDLTEIVEFETGYRGGNCFAIITPLPEYGEFDVSIHADKASAIEARRAETLGSVADESAASRSEETPDV